MKVSEFRQELRKIMIKFSKQELIDKLSCKLAEKNNKKQQVLDLIFEYGGINGSHHKQWLLNEIVKVITEDEYKNWTAYFENGEDGPKTYEWDIGIAP